MNVGVGIGLFICLVSIVIAITELRHKTYCEIDYLKNKVEYLGVLYHSIDKIWGDMFDVMKGQQEEIKELRRMVEPKEEKKCCCGNCRFYYELNNQSSACLNVNVNNKHKGDSTLYAENKPITCGTIKRVEPGGICEYYEPEEVSDEHTD